MPHMGAACFGMRTVSCSSFTVIGTANGRAHVHMAQNFTVNALLINISGLDF